MIYRGRSAAPTGLAGVPLAGAVLGGGRRRCQSAHPDRPEGRGRPRCGASATAVHRMRSVRGVSLDSLNARDAEAAGWRAAAHGPVVRTREPCASTCPSSVMQAQNRASRVPDGGCIAHVCTIVSRRDTHSHTPQTVPAARAHQMRLSTKVINALRLCTVIHLSVSLNLPITLVITRTTIT